MTRRRAPIDRLLDLAVAVPTCTLVAASRAVPIAARVGTRGTARLVGRVSDAVHDMRHGEDVEHAVGEAIADVARPEASSAPPLAAIPVGDLPIEGYDDLAARQVVDRLAALVPAELAQIEAYERVHRNRSTVLGKIAMLSA